MEPILPYTDNEAALLQAYAQVIDGLKTDAPDITVRSMDVNLIRYLCGLEAEWAEYLEANDNDKVSELGDCYWHLARLSSKIEYDYSTYRRGLDYDNIKPAELLDVIEKELRSKSRCRTNHVQLLNHAVHWQTKLGLECEGLGVSLALVLHNNIDKLADRKAKGKITR